MADMHTTNTPANTPPFGAAFLFGINAMRNHHAAYLTRLFDKSQAPITDADLSVCVVNAPRIRQRREATVVVETRSKSKRVPMRFITITRKG